MQWKSIGETSINTLTMENNGRQKKRGNNLGNRNNSRNEPCQIVGMGKVQIKQNNGNQWLLKRGDTYTIFEKKSNFNRAVRK
jgi:hypothetical protein